MSFTSIPVTANDKTNDKTTPTPTRTTTPKGSALKPIYPPHLWWRDITNQNVLFPYIKMFLHVETATKRKQNDSIFKPYD